MQLHQLKPIHRKKGKKRVGRGGKRGTYSGKGLKGQKSRAGRKMEPIIRVLVKKYPKIRGYKLNSWRTSPAIVNVGSLNDFKAGQMITPALLIEKKIIRRIKGKIPKVKILGKGEITKSLTIKNCQLSETAKEKIEKAGGKIK